MSVPEGFDVKDTVYRLGAAAFLALVLGGLCVGAGLLYLARQSERRSEVLASTHRQIESTAGRVEARVKAMEVGLVNALTPPRGAGDSGSVLQQSSRGARAPAATGDACQRLERRFPKPLLRLAERATLTVDSPSTSAGSLPIPRGGHPLERRLVAKGGKVDLEYSYGDVPQTAGPDTTGELACDDEAGGADRVRWLRALLSVDGVLEGVTRAAGEESLVQGFALVQEGSAEVAWTSPEGLPLGLRSLKDLLPSGTSGVGSHDGQEARIDPAIVLGAVTNLLQQLPGASGEKIDLGSISAATANPSGGSDLDPKAAIAAAIHSWTPLSVRLRGEVFHVLCRPVGLGETEPGGGLAVCGFLAEARLRDEVGGLRSEWLAPALTVLALLIAAFPLLKVWTIGEWERLAARDVRLLVGSAFVAATLATYVLAEGSDRRTLRAQLDGQLEELASTKGSELRQEIVAAVAQLDELLPDLALDPPPEAMRLESPMLDVIDVVRVAPTGALAANYEVVRGEAAAGDLGGEVPRLVRVPSPGISVEDRLYFQDAQRGAWRRLPDEAVRGKRFNVQISASKTTGIPLLIVAMPLGGRNETGAPRAAGELGLLTVRPRLFHQAIPRKPFGFAVVTATGRVLLHSDPSRNESENLIAEAGGSATLEAVLGAQRPAFVSAVYEARPVRFRLEPLRDLGLTLVTFVDGEAANTISWEVFARWGMIAGPYLGAGIGVLLLVWLLAPRYRAPWLWPDREKVQTLELLALSGLLVLTAIVAAAAVDWLEAQSAIAIREGVASPMPLPSLGLLFSAPLAGLAGVALRVSLRRPLAPSHRRGAGAICAFFLVLSAGLMVHCWWIQGRLPAAAPPSVLRPWVLVLLGVTLLWSASGEVARRLLVAGERLRERGSRRSSRPRSDRPRPGNALSEAASAPDRSRRLAVLLLVLGAAALLSGLLEASGGSVRAAPALSILVGALFGASALTVGPATRAAAGSARAYGEALRRTIGRWLDGEGAFRTAYAIFLTSMLGLVAVGPSYVMHRNARSEVESELSHLARTEFGREAIKADPGAAEGGTGLLDAISSMARDERLRERLWPASWVGEPLVRRTEAILRGEPRSAAGAPGLADAPRPLSAHMAAVLPESANPLTARLRAAAPVVALAPRWANGAEAEEWLREAALLRIADRLALRGGLPAANTGDPYRVFVWLGGAMIMLLTVAVVRALVVKLLGLDADAGETTERRLPEVLVYRWLPSTWEAPAELDARATRAVIDLGAIGDHRALSAEAVRIAGNGMNLAIHRLEYVLADDELRSAGLAFLRERVASRGMGSILLTSAVDPVRFLEAREREIAGDEARTRANRERSDASAKPGRPGGEDLAPAEDPAPRVELAAEIAQWVGLLHSAACTTADVAAASTAAAATSPSERPAAESALDSDLVELVGLYEGDRALLESATAGKSRRLRGRFARLWDTLDQKERLTLIQLQQEGFVNPVRIRSLRRLMERGLVHRAPLLEVSPPSFGEFVATRETRATVRSWETPEERSAWARISRPLAFAVGGVTVLGLLLQGGTASQAAVLLGSLGSLGTAVPALLRLLGFMDTGGASPSRQA